MNKGALNVKEFKNSKDKTFQNLFYQKFPELLFEL